MKNQIVKTAYTCRTNFYLELENESHCVIEFFNNEEACRKILRCSEECGIIEVEIKEKLGDSYGK